MSKRITKMSMEVEFPLEITADILSRLPAESILKCKCVCKTWKTLIDDSLFLATYTARSHESFSIGDNGIGFCIMGHQTDIGYGSAIIHYGEYRPAVPNADSKAAEGAMSWFEVTKPPKLSPHKWFKEDITAKWSLIGSSNGLICLSACLPGFSQHTYNIYVYNPITKEYVNLGPETFPSPDPHYSYRAMGFGYHPDYSYRAMGFGYHPSTNEYKVIMINYESCYSSGHVKVYTLGGRSSSDHSSKCRWRDKGEIPYVFTTLYKPGVLVNGALHWLTKDHKIVCFDLADETFRNNITVPPGIVLNQHDELGVLGGCLCVYVNNIINVWVLKEYMVNESWIKIFSRENVNRPLNEEDIDVVLRSSIAFVSHFYSEKKKLSSYDPESESINVSKIECLIRDYKKLDIVAYTKSFVSLKALGEEDVQYIEDFQREFPFWLKKYFERKGAHQSQFFDYILPPYST